MVRPKVLIAEDELPIQDLLAGAFTDAGFAVLVASDGFQAMTKVAVEAAELAAIVTDIRLGAGPTGWDIGQSARNLVPRLPIIYISGDSLHDWPMRGVSHSLFVAKPFRLGDIVASMLKLVDDMCADQRLIA